jgi:ADP-ribose pyrophosphatase YjhB (NUDIX family)
MGWALPGGFVDYGESLESAALREVWEEASLRVALVDQFYTYSQPNRDPRHHSITTVFVASADGNPQAGDDAALAEIFRLEHLPQPIAFDHALIIADYKLLKSGVPRRDIFAPRLTRNSKGRGS